MLYPSWVFLSTAIERGLALGCIPRKYISSNSQPAPFILNRYAVLGYPASLFGAGRPPSLPPPQLRNQVLIPHLEFLLLRLVFVNSHIGRSRLGMAGRVLGSQREGIVELWMCRRTSLGRTSNPSRQATRPKYSNIFLFLIAGIRSDPFHCYGRGLRPRQRTRCRCARGRGAARY